MDAGYVVYVIIDDSYRSTIEIVNSQLEGMGLQRLLALTCANAA